MSPLPACSIASNNYLALASVFAASYREHHPGAEVWVCIADRRDPEVDYGALPFTCVFAEELGIPAFLNLAFRYDVLELNTAVKPFFLRHLRDVAGVERILYFDPDILVMDELGGLAEALDRHPLILTPHVTEPLDDAFDPAERKILQVGVYNLGFVGLRLDGSTAPFLDWWSDRLHRYCISDPRQGLFVDQLWMSFAPAFLDAVGILRDPIYNVAYWNLPHRRLRQVGDAWRIDDRPLGFFHFSGLGFDDLDTVSRHQDRIPAGARPELRPLFERYRDAVFAAGHGRWRALKYGYGAFGPGEIRIPWIARRALQRVDPRGRRWPDPFDLERPESYFDWLSEPLALPSGVLNRAVLALWEERADLIRAFPQVCGGDLARYLAWIEQEQLAGRDPLPRPFTAGLEVRPLPLPPRLAAQAPPLEIGVAPDDEILRALPLRRPGPWVSWLNETLPGAARRRPRLTRLMGLLHRARDDLRRDYPDPFDADLEPFAYWFCSDGAAELDLAPELVTPVRRSLPWRARLGLWRRLRRRPPPAARPTVPATPEGSPVLATEAGAPRTRPCCAASGDRDGPGLNVVGFFSPASALEARAHGTVAALAGAGAAHVSVALDQNLWGKSAHGRVHPPEGAPFPVTVLQVRPEETATAVAALPISATAGGLKIGYWRWDFAHLPLDLASSYAYLDEVWAPSRFNLEAFASLADVPVRLVPPHVAAPGPVARPDRSRLGLEPGTFGFFCSLDAGDAARANPWAAIEAVRRAALRAPAPLGLALRIERAATDPALVAELRRHARDAPVRFHVDPAVAEDELLAASDAWLSLDRGAGLATRTIRAMYLARPVVATAYGGVLEVLDETTGYPVGWTPVRLERTDGPRRAGLVWARPDVEEAVAAMLALLSDGEEAARRAHRGQARAAELYGVDAAAARFRSELERLERRS